MPAVSTEADNVDLLRRESGLLLPSLGRLPLWVRAGLMLLAIVALAGAAYYGATGYPDTSPPRGSALESRIAAVFSQPRATADGSVVGDYLIERFYAMDVETGRRYIADVMKGRITAVQSAKRDEEGAESYTLLLDLRNLQRDLTLFAAFVEQSAPPRADASGEYLGLRVLPGIADAFPLNYDATLPEQWRRFRSPEGEDAATFLGARKLSDVPAPMPLAVDGFNYLLSSTDYFSFFEIEFGIEDAVFLSELVIIDATSRAQQTAYYELVEQLPRSPLR
jgi:hypothetical protein